MPLNYLFCYRYGNANVWKTFTDLFDYFPLTALVRRSSLPYIVISKFLIDMYAIRGVNSFFGVLFLTDPTQMFIKD